MTLAALLASIEVADIRISSDGQHLHFDAPSGALTSEVRTALIQHKPALVAAFAPPRGFVGLRGGLTVPIDAWMLGLDLEARGVPLATDPDHQLVIDVADPRLTDTDRAAIARWRRHLAALVEYEVPEGVQ